MDKPPLCRAVSGSLMVGLGLHRTGIYFSVSCVYVFHKSAQIALASYGVSYPCSLFGFKRRDAQALKTVREQEPGAIARNSVQKTCSLHKTNCTSGMRFQLASLQQVSCVSSSTSFRPCRALLPRVKGQITKMA